MLSMLTITLFATYLSLLLTIALLWINPFRFSNQAFALTTSLQSIWLFSVYKTISAGELTNAFGTDEIDYWFRVNGMIVSLILPSIWLVTNSILFSSKGRLSIIKRTLPILIVSMLLMALCLDSTFAIKSTPHLLTRGAAYFIFIFICIALFTLCIFHILRNLNSHRGIRRLELQFLALNSGGAALLLGILNAIGNFTNERQFNRLGIYVLIAASALTAWALLFHRVFNAREVLLRLGQRGAFVLAICGGTYASWSMLHRLLPEPVGLLLSVGMCSCAALWVDRASRAWFDGGGRRKLEAMRKAAIDISQSEVQVDKLIDSFEKLLQSETGARGCTILFDQGETYVSGTLSLPRTRTGFAALLESGWTTPESLLRRRPEPALRDLHEFVDAHGLGLMISTPKGSPTPSMIIAWDKRADESPFTYPEIERLQNLVTLIDNLLARARRVAHAALIARTEYLALASRGLAHDLKNLITPVSTFLVHTDGMFPPESPAGEVHTAARRATEIMTDYVRENLFFAEKLTPKIERFRVADMMEEVHAAVQLQAKTRGVRLALAGGYAVELSADRVLLQRMLANLVANAIEASGVDGEVAVTVRPAASGTVRFEVSDQGTGIAQEHLARIFDPYFTTKEFGSELRGIGLGLTIAQKIVLIHGGTLSVSSRAGAGSTFLAEIPDARSEPAGTAPRRDTIAPHFLASINPATP